MPCAWFGLAAAGADPPSWQIARRLMGEGFAGALVPSFAIGARGDWANLVFWNWGETLPHRGAVYDPNHQRRLCGRFEVDAWFFASRTKDA
jgi:RES domain-containing protein